MSPPAEQIHLAEYSDIAPIQSFYLSVGYGCEVKPDDQLLIARTDKSIIAAVRLCREFNKIVLRGMFVADERQGQGIGTRMLESTSAVIGESECWCIPYAHLANFYSRIGFRVCEGEEVPPFLADRWKKYTTGGKNVVIMKRPATLVDTPALD